MESREMAEHLGNDQIDSRIAERRTAEITLAVKGADGKILKNTEVTIKQQRHQFLFGCNAFQINGCATPKDRSAYRRRFNALLNFATLPFYWGGYEPVEGCPHEKRLADMARWCVRNGVLPKGHPLAWHEVAAQWLTDKPLPEFERLQMERIRREVSSFAGLVDTWDVVNEAVVLPRWQGDSDRLPKLSQKLGTAELLSRCFAAAREANPRATLLLNDFDTSPAYARLIGQCLDRQVPIDAIGIQSHMHTGYWGAEKAWEVCERFARFGKPLHFTELTILSGRLKWYEGDWHTRQKKWSTTKPGEQSQAERAAEFYRVLFSHPAVEAITWWDFSDQNSWMAAPSGLLRKNMTPKPAYLALKNLIKKDWWTGPLKLTTNGNGTVRFRGYLGSYSAKAAGGKGSFELAKPGKAKRTVSLG